MMPTLYMQRRQRTRSAFVGPDRFSRAVGSAFVGPDRFYRAVGLRRKPFVSLLCLFNKMLSL